MLHRKIVRWCLRSVRQLHIYVCKAVVVVVQERERERRYCAWLRWYVCASGIISFFIISNGFTAMAVASVPGAGGQECVCLCACGYSP